MSDDVAAAPVADTGRGEQAPEGDAAEPDGPAASVATPEADGGAPVPVPAAAATGSDDSPEDASPEDARPEDASPEKAESDMDHPLIREILLDPSRWRIWPAVAVLRWLLRRTSRAAMRMVYRSRPALRFPTAEVDDVAIEPQGVELTLTAPGVAAHGSPLPSSDIARIIADARQGGGLGQWLDAMGDRFMHVVETAQARHNAGFAVATGGQVEAQTSVAEITGRSMPLGAFAGGVLAPASRGLDGDYASLGALGLAAMFYGPPSASGLAQAVSAFTGLPVHVEEFAGAEVAVLRPARLGAPIGAMLGSSCMLPAAGINVVIEGGREPRAQEWARDARRRASLGYLARTYIGSASPQARIFLTLEVGNAPPAALDVYTALGGLAVLGEANETIRLPLAA